MSDELNKLMLQVDESAELDKKYQELRAKKIELDLKRVNYELSSAKQDELDIQMAKNANFGNMTEEQVENLIKVNDEYIESARKRMMFIDPIFNDCVPFFKKNIIFIGATTGSGKSTTVANIVRTTIIQKNKETGQPKKVLVLTNEERAEDFYNRITCQIKGWHYTNHDKFTDEQRAVFSQYIKLFAGTGMVTVVDDNYGGSSGVTTTVEGLQAVFENLIEKQQYYDVIIIDYYQNFKFSKENSKLTEWDVQQKVSALLDGFKNRYPAPIVLLGQIEPQKSDEEKPFQYRIKGRKVIMDVCTIAMELIADRDNLRNEWKVHKSRFTEGVVGQSFYTGYDNGKFVSYDAKFREKVLEIQQKRQQEMFDRVGGQMMNKKADKT